MAMLEDKVNTGTLWIISVVGCVVTFAIVIFLKSMFYTMQTRLETEIGTANNRSELNEAREQQERELEEYGFIDQAAGTIHLPIELSMERVVANGGKVK